VRFRVEAAGERRVPLEGRRLAQQRRHPVELGRQRFDVPDQGGVGLAICDGVGRLLRRREVQRDRLERDERRVAIVAAVDVKTLDRPACGEDLLAREREALAIREGTVFTGDLAIRLCSSSARVRGASGTRPRSWRHVRSSSPIRSSSLFAWRLERISLEAASAIASSSTTASDTSCAIEISSST
jgi:hypothetical protein